MKFVNTLELKNRLNALLAEVSRGESLVVTIRGKPSAAILPATEEELDQVLFERGAAVRRAIWEGLRDLKAGRFTTLRDYIGRRFGKGSRKNRR